MKKLIPFLVLLTGVTGALAQGTVDFNNNRSWQTRTNEDRKVYAANMTSPLTGTNYAAQLWYGADPGSLQAATGAPSRFRVSTTSQPGTWSGATRTLVGVLAQQSTMLQVRVWDLNRFATFAEARAAGGEWAESALFAYQVPVAGAPPTAYYMENLVGGPGNFSLVPEPSVIGLGLIGAGALFLLRRRKS